MVCTCCAESDLIEYGESYALVLRELSESGHISKPRRYPFV